MTEHINIGIGPERFGADIPMAAQERFVTRVYRYVDRATAGGLDRLRADQGIVPACKPGCCHCCRYHILINRAEAHTLAQYIKREFSQERMEALRRRTQQWHAWDDSRPGRYPSAGLHAQTDLSGYEHGCPLLVDGICSVYPVRPVVCRTHFVSSLARLCQAANDPQSTEDTPVVLSCFVKEARRYKMALSEQCESAGSDGSLPIMLLPHWLAAEMNWDFTAPPRCLPAS